MLRTDTENASTRPSLSPNGLQARIAARIGTVTKNFFPKRPGSASAIHFSSAANYNVIFKTIDDSIMLTFQQFLQDTAEKGRTTNTLFEERLFALVGTLDGLQDLLPLQRSPTK